MAPMGGLESGLDEDEATKAAARARRAARFNNQLVGNRHKQLEEARIGERKAFEQQGLIRAGKTELGEAVDMRGTCERMCSEYEAEFREFTGEVHPLEAKENDKRRIDHSKAVAAYTRSDAGAGHGEAAKLPSDLRTPSTLVKTLDYLFSSILPSQPSPPPAHPTPRTALGYTAGFIRDRTRAIRKEFAMQSSWGQMEAIESFERIARWHILCLRELQEESGMNTDMHIDSAELGRCFTSLRQHYNDRREETGDDLPCPNEPEFRAYMLIFDLTQKAVAISTAEVPSVILDHPNVQLAWQIRRAAQRNFDTQKEGSKQNAELGANIITSFVKLLQQASVPYLLSCLVEVRLREIRRSALRALSRAYPRLRQDPIRRGEDDRIVERRMLLLPTMAKILGCEEQETEESAWEDTERFAETPEMEAVEIAKRFGLEVWEEVGQPVGVIINLGIYFDDNKDAPYTRRWKHITDKRSGITYSDIINGRAGVQSSRSVKFAPTSTFRPVTSASTTFRPPIAPAPPKQIPAPTSFSFGIPAKPAVQPISQPKPPQADAGPSSAGLPAGPASRTPAFAFGLPKTGSPSVAPPTAAAPAPEATRPPKRVAFSFETPPPAAAPAPSPTGAPALNPFPFTSTVPAAQPPPAPKATTTNTSEVLSRPSFFSTPAVAGPSTPSIATPPPVVPSTPITPASTSRTPLSESTSSTPRRASLKYSSLTRSTSRTLASPEAKLRSRRAAIQPLANTLITEILQSFITSMTPDLALLVKSQIAAQEYVARKAQRQRTIESWSPCIFDKMLEEISARIAREAFARQIAKRGKARQSIRHWKEWTKEREETRETADKDRRDVWEKLRDMGLGGEEGADGRLIRGDSIHAASERVEERQLDMGLHEAERVKENFYSPSSFIHTIARQISPILASPHSEDVPPRFQVLLSTSADSASPPPPAASKWLVDKITPRIEEGGSWWPCEGVKYATEVKSRYDELDSRRLGRLGMVLVEVPMSSALNKERDTNIADVQDRLAAIIEVAKKSSVAYNAPLLLLTWQEETLEEISERLDLAEYLPRFGGVSVMCLSQIEDLDTRFAESVKGVVSTAMVRNQLVLAMSEAVVSIMPIWQRLLDFSTLLLRDHPTDAKLAMAAFRSGIDSLNDIAQTIRGWLKRAQVDKNDDFDPVIIPAFEAAPADDIPSTISAIEQYLESDVFAGLQDIQLSGSNLYSAAIRHEALPLAALLGAISTFTLGELSHTHLPLEIYGTPIYIHARHSDFIAAVTATYQYSVEVTIASLASSVPTQQVASPESTSTSSRTARKRPAGGDGSPPGTLRESKSAKNARLLKTIKEVERSIGGMSEGAGVGSAATGDGGGSEIWV